MPHLNMSLDDGLPNQIAKKNSQNGTPNWPHIIPARSKSGFGT